MFMMIVLCSCVKYTAVKREHIVDEIFSNNYIAVKYRSAKSPDVNPMGSV